MRQKEWKLVVTFESTQEAMRMEKVCEEEGVIGRLIPVPTEISAGCGLCWCSKDDCEDDLGRILKTKFKDKEIVKMKI